MESTSQAMPLERVRIQINPCRKSLDKEIKFVICSFDTISERCLQVTARRVLQVEYLVQYMTERHGGHIIPVLLLFNTFSKDNNSQQSLFFKICQYLNDLIKNPYCQLQPKLYEFIFQQQVHFPQLQRYEKVLSDAAMISRKYLNTIFTRKQYGEVQAQDREMLGVYERFKRFTGEYRAVRDILVISGKQHQLLEDISAVFRDIRGGLAKGLPPIDFVNKKMGIKMIKLEKLIKQGDEAYSRWDVLRETVKQLQCNLNKGLHEDNPYYKLKYNQLKEWTRTLIIDLLTLIDSGNQIVAEFSQHLYDCRRDKASWFEPQDPALLPPQSSLKDQVLLPASPKNLVKSVSQPPGRQPRTPRKMSI